MAAHEIVHVISANQRLGDGHRLGLDGELARAGHRGGGIVGHGVDLRGLDHLALGGDLQVLPGVERLEGGIVPLGVGPLVFTPQLLELKGE